MSTKTHPAHTWQPFCDGFIDNPYPHYERVRQAGPAFKAHTGEWLITDYNHTKTLLAHPDVISNHKGQWIKELCEFMRSKGRDLAAAQTLTKDFLILMDGDAHATLRDAIAHAWPHSDLPSLADDTVETILDTINLSEDINAVTHIAQPISTQTVSHLLGIPQDMAAEVRDVAINMLWAIDPYLNPKRLGALEHCANTLLPLFAKIRPESGIAKALGQSRLKDMPGIMVFLFVAGLETAASLMATAIWRLAHEPQWLDYLSHNPGKLGAFMEEILRLDGPVQFLGRRTTSEIRLDDITIPAGETITICLAAANRDPKVFDEPATFNPGRTPHPNLAFGHGRHLCIGASLARLQTKALIKSIADRRWQLSLCDNKLEFEENLSIRRIKNLKVRVNS